MSSNPRIIPLLWAGSLAPFSEDWLLKTTPLERICNQGSGSLIFLKDACHEPSFHFDEVCEFWVIISDILNSSYCGSTVLNHWVYSLVMEGVAATSLRLRPLNWFLPSKGMRALFYRPPALMPAILLRLCKYVSSLHLLAILAILLCHSDSLLHLEVSPSKPQLVMALWFN